MTLTSRSRVHIIGVGGAGMSGLARLLVGMGCRVSGSDASASAVLDELSTEGVEVSVGHDEMNGALADVVLWSPAVAEDNVEFRAAERRGATMLSRREVLATLGERQRVIGITGTHGKTTATSMLVHVMHAEGRDDSRLLGAPVIGVGANGHFGGGDLLLEVDESYGTFSQLRPLALGVLNVEADHLDHYGTVDVLETAFAELIGRTTGPVVVWGDDPGARRVAAMSAREVVRVGTRDAVWLVEDVVLERRASRFRLSGPSEAFEIELGVTGAHNVANAAVVAVLALSLGVSRDAVQRGLRAFAGAPRRFQRLGSWRGMDVYEDYAHLPGEITATLRAARDSGYRRIVAVFQPHRVTRTVNLESAFAGSFKDASVVIITDIYSAGEANPTGVTGERLATSVRESATAGLVAYAQTFDAVLGELGALEGGFDVLLLLGAGDIATIAARLPGGLDA